jgi:hypothetical protein
MVAMQPDLPGVRAHAPGFQQEPGFSILAAAGPAIRSFTSQN